MDLMKIASSSGHFFANFTFLHTINKVQLCCSILFIKTSSKLASSVGELFWPFGNFFDPVKCKVRFLFCDCLSLLFIDTSLSLLQCFPSLKFSPSLSSWPKPFRAFESPSGWLFSPAFIPLEVFSIPDLSDSVARDLLYSVKSSNDSAYQLQFVSPNLKFFYICNQAVWFWEQSYLSWKIPPMCWKYSLLPSWNKLKQICLGSVRICPWHIPNQPLHRLSWLWNLLLSPAFQQLEFIFWPDKTIIHLALRFGRIPKTKSLLLI